MAPLPSARASRGSRRAPLLALLCACSGSEPAAPALGTSPGPSGRAALYAEIDAGPTPDRRAALALALVGREADRDLEGTFLRVGALQPELRALLSDPAAAAPDGGGESPADRARRLLAAWGDPLATPPLAASEAKSGRPEGLAAATPEALCQAFAEGWFGAGDGEARGGCATPVRSPDGDHALLTLFDGGGDFSYTQTVSAVRRSGAWILLDTVVVQWGHGG